MKVIFLDIDGVLSRCGDCQQYLPEYIRQRRLGKSRLDQLDDDLVENFKRLLRITDAKVVISSTWRLHMMDQLKDEFERCGVDTSVIIGQTPNEGDRYMEILSWIFRYNKWATDSGFADFVGQWIAIDDDIGDMKPIDELGFLVKTSCNQGLTEEKMEEAMVKLL